MPQEETRGKVGNIIFSWLCLPAGTVETTCWAAWDSQPYWMRPVIATSPPKYEQKVTWNFWSYVRMSFLCFPHWVELNVSCCYLLTTVFPLLACKDKRQGRTLHLPTPSNRVEKMKSVKVGLFYCFLQTLELQFGKHFCEMASMPPLLNNTAPACIFAR